ncbi:MAG: haloacid dehalogenase-like hydrolase, partial [bacterium]|nr:haloacid dehalogenase-like hydrolase [bacterium]
LFDDIVCASLTRTRSGSDSTGQLATVPPTGESRAEALLNYAAREGLSLAESVAYADSTSDLPMLEAVGFPVAVNPETKLATLARRRGWLIENFRQAPGGPRKLLPLAEPLVRR